MLVLPIANGIINKPTNMSLTARLTISIFDAVCNFLTRETANITTRFPTIVIILITEQIIIIITKCATLRGSFRGILLALFVKLLSSLFVVIEIDIGVVDVSDSGDRIVVGNIRRRGVLNIADEPFVKVKEDDDDGIRCCWAADTDDSNEIIDNNEINSDVQFE